MSSLDDDDGRLTLTCPYCWASVELWLDRSDRGEMVIDCEVCCRPWLLTISDDGQVVVERAQ